MIDPDLEREILSGVRSPQRDVREAAFTRLCAAIQAPVLGVCADITGQRADAEDAFQETLLAIQKGLPEFRGTSRLSTWIWRIAVRAAIRQRARVRRHAADPIDVDPVDPATASSPLSSSTSDRLDRALATLSAEQRTVLALFCVEENTHDEIAAVLGVPVGTVWSRLHQARKRLAAALERIGAA